MEEKYMAVAFTGHRPETIPYIDDTDSDQYFHLEKSDLAGSSPVHQRRL